MGKQKRITFKMGKRITKEDYHNKKATEVKAIFCFKLTWIEEKRNGSTG